MGANMLYEIRVESCLPADWSDWFEGQVVTDEQDNMTVILAIVADQAALHGLIARVRDLGLVLLSVNRLTESEYQVGR